jgi:hypothetical protein
MVELQVNVPTTCPGWLFSIYAANTVLLIATNIFALMVSTCLLPRMSAVSEEYDVNNLKSVPTFSPHDRLQGLISLSAGLAHVFGLSVFVWTDAAQLGKILGLFYTSCSSRFPDNGALYYFDRICPITLEKSTGRAHLQVKVLTDQRGANHIQELHMRF